jgi:hypothetical protein
MSGRPWDDYTRKKWEGNRPWCKENLRKWREKNPDYQTGSNNPAWKGGTSRSSILRRARDVLDAAGVDQFTCQCCRRESPQYRFNVHHKDGNRENNELSNLEVLCPGCHNSGSPSARHTRQVDEQGRFTRGITIEDSKR